MRAALQIFVAGLSDLRAYLADADNETKLLTLLNAPERVATLADAEQHLLRSLSEARTYRRRYVYAVAIVSLYGLLERYFDALVERFVETISGFASIYDEVPEVIRRHHIGLSLDLAKAIVDDRYKTDASSEQIIANLHSCLAGSTPFRLNGAAFVMHRGNISLPRIEAILASVGILKHLRQITHVGSFIGFMKISKPEIDILAMPDEELTRLFSTISDLVERRNQIAHGVIEVDDIQSNDLLYENCEFIEAYGRALYEVVSQGVLQKYIEMPGTQNLDAPIAVFGNSIVCFRSSSAQIKVGDILVARTGDAQLPMRFSTIENIEINNERHNEITLTTATEFGLKVGFRVRRQFSYHVVPAGTV